MLIQFFHMINVVNITISLHYLKGKNEMDLISTSWCITILSYYIKWMH